MTPTPIYIRTSTDLKTARAITVKTSDAYIVLLNPSLSPSSTSKTILHELCHIQLGHLDSLTHLPEAEKEQQVLAMLNDLTEPEINKIMEHVKDCFVELGPVPKAT